MNLNKVERMFVRDITSAEIIRSKAEPLVESQKNEVSNEIPDLRKQYFSGNSSADIVLNQNKFLKNHQNVERKFLEENTRLSVEGFSEEEYKIKNIEKMFVRGLTSDEIIKSQKESAYKDYQREASKMSIDLEDMFKSLTGLIPDDDNKKTENKRKPKRFKNKVLPPLKAQSLSNQMPDETKTLLLARESTLIVKYTNECDPNANLLVALPSSTQIPFLHNNENLFAQNNHSFVIFFINYFLIFLFYLSL